MSTKGYHTGGRVRLYLVTSSVYTCVEARVVDKATILFKKK